METNDRYGNYRKSVRQFPFLGRKYAGPIWILQFLEPCCGYSLEVPRRGASNEYPQHMFSLRNKKTIMWIPPLICSYEYQCICIQFDEISIKFFSGYLAKSKFYVIRGHNCQKVTIVAHFLPQHSSSQYQCLIKKKNDLIPLICFQDIKQNLNFDINQGQRNM